MPAARSRLLLCGKDIRSAGVSQAVRIALSGWHVPHAPFAKCREWVMMKTDAVTIQRPDLDR